MEQGNHWVKESLTASALPRAGESCAALEFPVCCQFHLPKNSAMTLLPTSQALGGSPGPGHRAA